MSILHYDEVTDDQMTELTLTCFNHPYSKEHVERMIQADERIPEWGGELYFEKGDTILGTLGLLYPRVRTKKGVEKAGGIRNVCTRPSASRRGVAKKLFSEAHDRMREEGVRWVFLMTSKSLVAYNLYRKLGYHDIHVYPAAYKQTEEVESDVELRDEADPGYIREVYMGSVEGLTGLVEREESFWDMAEARGWPENSDIKTVNRQDEKIGYVMVKESRNQLVCEELAAENSDIKPILKELERGTDKEYLVLKYVNPNYVPMIKDYGFDHYQDRWSRIMVKDFQDDMGETSYLLGKGDTFHNGTYESY